MGLVNIMKLELDYTCICDISATSTIYIPLLFVEIPQGGKHT